MVILGEGRMVQGQKSRGRGFCSGGSPGEHSLQIQLDVLARTTMGYFLQPAPACLSFECWFVPKMR